MPDQLQLRGGTTTEHNSFTGAIREVTVDTTKKTLVVHDGATAGGTALMKESGGTAASSITLGTGGTSAVTIDSNQNVGIGIASPNNTTKLHLATAQTGTAGGTGLTMSGWNGTAEARVQLMAFGVGGGTLAIRSGTGNTERLRMDQSGNFGVGRSSPVHKFDVNGNIRGTLGRFGSGSAAEPTYSFHSDANTGMYHSGTDMLSFATAGTERLNIDAVGNVTIKGGQSLFFHNGFSNSTSRIQNAGSSNNSTMRFLTRLNGTEGERMVITSSGKVGIGTTSPNSLLNIHGVFETNAFDSTSGNGGRFTAKGLLIGDAFTAGKSSSDDRNSIIWNERGLDIVFATSDTERMKIDSAGKVGIGNTSPASFDDFADLLVVGTTSGNNGITIVAGSSNHSSIYFADGTSGGSQKNAGIVDYNHSTDSMRFATAANDAMRIHSTGVVQVMSENLTMGTSTTTGGASQGNLCIEFGANVNAIKTRNTEASGTHNHMVMVNGSTLTGSISGSTSSVSFNNLSDYRAKENAVSISDGITRIKTLKPYRFNFIIEPSKTIDGFFAHEVTPAVPEAVTGEKDAVDSEGKIDPQMLDSSKLIPLLVAAVQELIGKVEALEAA